MFYTLSSLSVKKSRKSHCCIWCGETINKGDPAYVSNGVFEGEFDSQRYHPECKAACHQWYEQEKMRGECFDPYEFARGSPLIKSDYAIMKQREAQENA